MDSCSTFRLCYGVRCAFWLVCCVLHLFSGYFFSLINIKSCEPRVGFLQILATCWIFPIPSASIAFFFRRISDREASYKLLGIFMSHKYGDSEAGFHSNEARFQFAISFKSSQRHCKLYCGRNWRICVISERLPTCFVQWWSFGKLFHAKKWRFCRREALE